MPKKIRVCNGPHCSYRKSNRIMDALRNYFSTQKITGSVDLDYCACTGFCEEGPSVVVDDELLYRHADVKTIGGDIEEGKGKKLSELTAEPTIDLDLLINDL